MPPIPAKLNARLYKVLAQCGPFDTHQALRAVFADERLYSWRNAIPETTTRADRIAALIDALHNQSTVAGDNALVLFILVLLEQVESSDNQCQRDLLSLASELEDQFRVYSTLHPSDPPEVQKSTASKSFGDSNALKIARRALAILEEQAAGFGKLHIPSHLQIELEEKCREVAELEAQIGSVAQAARGTEPLVSAPTPVTLHRVASQPSVFPVREHWALLVGVDRYVDPGFPNLRFCVNDVLALQATLEAAGYTVVALHDAAPAEHLLPTRDNIEAELARICKAAGRDDLIWVHFSCHGKLVEGQPVLITRESRTPTLAKKALRLAEVEQALRGSLARRRVLTLDACHTGVEIGRDLADPEFIRNAYELAEGSALLAASTSQQVAQEWAAKEHGVFTYFLLEGLSGKADRANKGFITVNDLTTHTLDGLRRWNVTHGGILQEPTARVEGMGDMILVDFGKPSVPPVSDKEAIAWFANIGLIGNPFEHLTAEEDEALSRYQIQLQELRPLERHIRGDDTASRWIIFAKRGCGKTALCQMVRRSHYPFKKDHILGIMLDAEALNNVLAYADHALETLLPIHYIKVVEDLIPDSIKISKLAYTSGMNARQALNTLTQVIINQGFKYLLCLVDQVDEVELVEAQPEKMVQLMKPLMQLSQQTLPGIAFRYFLPAEIDSLMQAQHTIFRLDRYQVVHLRWTEEDLARLIAQRLSAFSKYALNPYTSLGQLCEPGANFDAPVNLALVRLAEGSPRAAVWLANRLIQVHCQAENPPRFIQPATWQQVKADWRLYGRDQLFGSPARSEAFVLAGDCIYFQGEEVILSEKYDALLRSLVQAGDRVCTKEELIRAGWPGDRPEGVTDTALAEAIRRMKAELEKLGGDSRWVNTVRGRGYRLQKPKGE